MPYSYHSHSGQFCHHGYGELEQVIQQAIKKGFKIYGLTEHMPRYENKELYPEEIEAQCTPKSLMVTFENYIKEAKRLREKYKQQIQIIIGSELEFIHQEYQQYILDLRKKWENDLDYVIGSLHHTGGIPIDFSPELYQQALTTLAQDNIVVLFEKYFDEQWVMLQSVQPQVIGHFDLIRIFATKNQSLEAFQSPTVWQRMERNIDYIIQYGGLFELNSRAWKKGLDDAYPQRDIIKMILEKGGKLTLSDDCHGPNDVGMHYDILYKYLKELNIQTIYYLTIENNQLAVKEHQHILQDSFWDQYKKEQT
ncbi:unnamed protein product [Cunninghamella blakesleeana]